MVEFIRVETVLALHDRAVELFGGLPGLRDDGLLDSAIARAQNLFAYNDAVDVFDLAAAYAFGIARNHAFHDANKRTAYSCCMLFLELNGVAVVPEPAVAVEQMVALASGGLDEATFAAWLRSLATG